MVVKERMQKDVSKPGLERLNGSAIRNFEKLSSKTSGFWIRWCPFYISPAGAKLWWRSSLLYLKLEPLILSQPSAAQLNHLTHGPITAGDEGSLAEAAPLQKRCIYQSVCSRSQRERPALSRALLPPSGVSIAWADAPVCLLDSSRFPPPAPLSAD